MLNGGNMLLADWLSDFLENACLISIVIFALIGWAIERLMKSAGDVLQDENVREAAEFGLWWFLSGDDDD
jgi:hypothetical protein